MTAIATWPRLRREPATAKLGSVDWSLILFVLLQIPVGLLAIYSATRGEVGLGQVSRQIVFVGVGLVALAVVSAIDYQHLRHFLGLIQLATVTMLVLVLLIGVERSGTRGWFVIAGISLQPAEFAKIGLILSLAAVFTGRTGNAEAPRFTAGLSILAAVVLLVLLERETGSVLVYCFIALGIFYIAGVPVRWVLLLIVSGVAAFSVVLTSGMLEDYQQARLTSFIGDPSDPVVREQSYNQRQSVTAVGSGGLTGAGIFEGPQTQLDFVPAQETDFIFTVIAEETGFVGAVTVLGIQALIMGRILRASRLSRDGFGTLICVGVFMMLLIQTFQNVGMALKLMPITGIPLPFVSYGGSSLLTSLVAVGLVQSVVIHRHRGTPDE
ncbi:MAG: FtsW/RodA/SpoVE family cell cycle protein [Acidimicrobiales bacterium]